MNRIPRVAAECKLSPGATKKDGRILVLAAAIITGLRLARDPRAGCQTERVVNAVEDGIWLANQFMTRLFCGSGRGISITSGERHRMLGGVWVPSFMDA